MALLRNMPENVKEERAKISNVLDAFDKEHGISFEAEIIFSNLKLKGFVLTKESQPWTVIEIHDLVDDLLNRDLDLEDIDLFGDLLFLFNNDQEAL